MVIETDKHIREPEEKILENVTTLILTDLGYKIEDKDSSRIKFVKGDREVWVWMSSMELEFIDPNIKNKPVDELKEKLENLMEEVEEIYSNDKWFYLIGIVRIGKHMDEYIKEIIETVEEYMNEYENI